MEAGFGRQVGVENRDAEFCHISALARRRLEDSGKSSVKIVADPSAERSSNADRNSKIQESERRSICRKAGGQPNRHSAGNARGPGAWPGVDTFGFQVGGCRPLPSLPRPIESNPPAIQGRGGWPSYLHRSGRVEPAELRRPSSKIGPQGPARGANFGRFGAGPRRVSPGMPQPVGKILVTILARRGWGFF